MYLKGEIFIQWVAWVSRGLLHNSIHTILCSNKPTFKKLISIYTKTIKDGYIRSERPQTFYLGNNNNLMTCILRSKLLFNIRLVSVHMCFSCIREKNLITPLPNFNFVVYKMTKNVILFLFLKSVEKNIATDTSLFHMYKISHFLPNKFIIPSNLTVFIHGNNFNLFWKDLF